MIFFAAATAFFMVLLFRSEFTHYDNFSHWGVAAKIVSQKDMFPNTSDTNLMFQSYPLGSAAFLYYFTEIVGTDPEWLQMWAQAVLMVGMLVSLFAFAKGLHGCLIACVGAVMLLCSNISFVDLLVDTLLPVVAIGAVSFCIYYRKELEDKIWFVISYGVFLVSIKNSGALFAVIVLVYVLIQLPKTKDNCKKWGITALAPVMTVFLWNRHVEQVFDDGALSKHAMRMDNFQQVLAGKTTEDLTAIMKLFGEQAMISLKPVAWLLILAILLLICRKCIMKRNCREICAVLALGGVSYLLYQIGTLGMYLLSMPVGEALTLAGYSRYHQTILAFVSGIFLIAVLQGIWDADGRVLQRLSRSLLTVSVIFVLATVLKPNFNFYKKQDLTNTERAKFDRLINDYGVWPNDSYLILVSEDRQDYGYLYYMTQYLLKPEKVAIVPAATVKELPDESFGFVIMFEDTEENSQYLLDQFGLDEEVGYIGDKSIK